MATNQRSSHVRDPCRRLLLWSLGRPAPYTTHLPYWTGAKHMPSSSLLPLNRCSRLVGTHSQTSRLGKRQCLFLPWGAFSDADPFPFPPGLTIRVPNYRLSDAIFVLLGFCSATALIPLAPYFSRHRSALHTSSSALLGPPLKIFTDFCPIQ